MGQMVWRDFFINLAATAVSELSSPSGMMAYFLTMALAAFFIRKWRGMESWQFIAFTLAITLAAGGAAAYGTWLRYHPQPLKDFELSATMLLKLGRPVAAAQSSDNGYEAGHERAYVIWINHTLPFYILSTKDLKWTAEMEPNVFLGPPFFNDHQLRGKFRDVKTRHGQAWRVFG